MANTTELKIPNLGGAHDVDVIEILVKPGDHIKVEDALITLESDKATMEIPATTAGVISDITIKIGDKVSEGDLILTLTAANDAQLKEASDSSQTTDASTTKATDNMPSATATSAESEVRLPDLGTTDLVDVIELNIKIGDVVSKEQTLLTLESDKATMEIPSPYDGEISQLHIKEGDKVTQDALVAHIKTSAAVTTSEAPQSAKADSHDAPATPEVQSEQATPTTPASKPSTSNTPSVPVAHQGQQAVYAGPAVRRFARELGVDLTQVSGSGRKDRITKEDVQQFVKNKMTSSASSTMGLAIAPPPQIDFTQFGATETMALTKINKLTGQFMQRNWLTVPHVTQFEDVDITELEAFRKAQKASAEKQGFKLTPIVFIMKAVVSALKALPKFNSSLDTSGENLILKKYYNLGIAVDTPNGLVVPVIRNVDQKSLFDLAKELGEISLKAREKGLSPSDMQGGCFTISSLGGIGGTAFTPIVNVPEVAILGVSKASIQPAYLEGEFKPRLMLPLSLSYDHRVIDGAGGARFTSHVAKQLSDIRCLLL